MGTSVEMVTERKRLRALGGYIPDKNLFLNFMIKGTAILDLTYISRDTGYLQVAYSYYKKSLY